jgi:hypothetical protein
MHDGVYIIPFLIALQAGVDLLTLAARLTIFIRYAHPGEEHQFEAMHKPRITPPRRQRKGKGEDAKTRYNFRYSRFLTPKPWSARCL